MNLKPEHKDMLEGRYGEGVAKAMEIQTAIGETFDAKRMVPITRAHVALSSQDADLWFVEKMLSLGATCKVSPTVNPSIDLKYLNQHLFEIPKAGVDIVSATNAAYQKIGATLTFDCTPYLQQNVPGMGEVIAFSESSATPYVNSVLGARSNRESSQSALCAAVTGLVPEYGLLLDEHRYGEILVEVEADIETDFDYQLLGWCYPELYKGLEIPVFTGIKARPTPAGFMNFGAQLNTSGAVSMYHIVGVTPEAPTLEAAFGANKVKHRIKVTNDDIARTRDRLCRKGEKIDFAMFGCPHLTITQVETIAKTIAERRFAVDFWVLTSSLTKELAERMGYLDIIQRAGGHIVADTCIDVPPCWQPYYGKVGVTDSPKCAYYNEIRGIKFIIRPIEECVEAAIVGEVLQ
ncbi:aconitase X catalytic domain-containing protein [Desulforhopalus singaporensis]|uniref:Predicted aconitase subunit 1 n=1 Tax=Desulforhopalus singaporensis TaxID=91360 RepID=A0A1H0UDW3_9BACT|nr:aconitase X catalytic domain-containing protein [Desulforhopalus singaporensis]SDP64178.1 predicted aconitase subunit 1 [Desulforhopalus singaporensis]